MNIDLQDDFHQTATSAGHSLLQALGASEDNRRKMEFLMKRFQDQNDALRRRLSGEQERNEELEREIATLRHDAHMRTDAHAREIADIEARSAREATRVRASFEERERQVAEEHARRDQRMQTLLEETKASDQHNYQQLMKVSAAFEVLVETARMSSRKASEENTSVSDLIVSYSSNVGDVEQLRIEAVEAETAPAVQPRIAVREDDGPEAGPGIEHDLADELGAELDRIVPFASKSHRAA